LSNERTICYNFILKFMIITLKTFINMCITYYILLNIYDDFVDSLTVSQGRENVQTISEHGINPTKKTTPNHI
jgi:hypothetical protein